MFEPLRNSAATQAARYTRVSGVPSTLRRLALLAAFSLTACPAPSPPAVPASSPPAPAASPPPCLSLVAWNDMHGQLSPDDPVIDTGRVPSGGVVAVADQI